MTPSQIAELIIGIARTQAAIVNAVAAVAAVVETGNGPSQLKQKVDNAVHSLQGGPHRQPPQWPNLNAQALQAVLARGSPAEKSLEKTMLAQVETLLQEHPQ